MSTPITEKALVVLGALDRSGPRTADEFVTARGWYVNSWAPTFTQLRKAGLVRRTGERRTTSHGAEAYVIEITEAGREFLVTQRREAAA